MCFQCHLRARGIGYTIKIMLKTISDRVQKPVERMRYFLYLCILNLVSYIFLSTSGHFVGDYFILFFYVLYSVAFVLISIGRLHDMNARGYWALTPPALFVLWIGLIARYAVAPSVTVIMRSFFLGIPAIICILVLVLIFTPSRTPNRFN